MTMEPFAQAQLQQHCADCATPIAIVAVHSLGGKSWLASHFPRATLDIDSLRTQQLDDMLAPLRKVRNWKAHNAIWYEFLSLRAKEGKLSKRVILLHSLADAKVVQKLVTGHGLIDPGIYWSEAADDIFAQRFRDEADRERAELAAENRDLNRRTMSGSYNLLKPPAIRALCSVLDYSCRGC